MSEEKLEEKPVENSMAEDDSLEDPRFQNTNASRYCYTHYVDYHRCQYLLGKDDISCNIFKRMYQRMCPNSWICRWDEQREKGIFPRDCKTELDWCKQFFFCKCNQNKYIYLMRWFVDIYSDFHKDDIISCLKDNGEQDRPDLLVWIW